MRTAALNRNPSQPDRTFGRITTDLGLQLWMLELPSRGNEPGKSCILAGIYGVTWRLSPAHGMCYHIENVFGRTNIEIHAANFPSQLLGCMAPGLRVGPLLNPTTGLIEMAVHDSRDALAQLEQNLQQMPFELTIV